MATDMFLQIDGIKGESTDDKHKDWIEVLSFSQGVQQPTSASRSTAGSGTTERASFNDLSVEKVVDSATTKLHLQCASGKHIKKVTLECCRALEGKKKVAFWVYELEDVVVSSVSVSGGGDLPTESIAFNFGNIKWKYTPTNDKTGAAGSPIPGQWDLEKNVEA